MAENNGHSGEGWARAEDRTIETYAYAIYVMQGIFPYLDHWDIYTCVQDRFDKIDAARRSNETQS